MDKQEKRVIEIGAVSAEEVLEEVMSGQNKENDVYSIPEETIEPKEDSSQIKEKAMESLAKDDESEEKEVMKKSSEKSTRSIYELLEEDIMASNIPDSEKTKKLSRLIRIRNKKVNIMLVGSTGSGKSSTVNAMFNMDIAKVGVGVDPETSSISKFELDNLIIWDTPGLGDGVESDKRITKSIISKLNESDEKGSPLIDMVLVIMDASSKDLGTSYDLINNVLIPCLGKESEKRILIGLNQSDIAMKGTHWIADKNEPDEILTEFLKKKAESVQKRIKEATGLNIQPVCYCAGYKEDGGEQRKPYNLTKLLYHIVMMIPREKRLALADNINSEEDNWKYDDHESDYRGGTQRGFCDTVWDCISEGAETGCEIGGKILGIPGNIVGGLIGGAVGAIAGIFGAIFG